MTSVSKVIDHLNIVYAAAESSLHEWSGIGCLKFSSFFNLIQIKLDWNKTQIKAHHHVLRFFIANHDNYSSMRGATGGIIRAEDKAKLDLVKQEKMKRRQELDQAKSDVESMLKAKMTTLTKEDMSDL